MAQPKRNQKTHSKITISTVEFYKIYMVMFHRLASGYSAYEQSFLLGKTDLFVRDVENPLKSKRYNIDDANYILLIYNLSWKDIIPAEALQDNYQLEVTSYPGDKRIPVYEIRKSAKESGSVLFRNFTLDKNEEKSEILIVTEEDKHVEPATQLFLSTYDDVKIYIDKLLIGIFFTEPKRALDIFKQCQLKFGITFHPRNMIKVLNFYTNKKSGVPKLDKERRDEFGRMLFVNSSSMHLH
ncbi:hypothetical protein [Mucilaginibacter sp.]|uniref:hypothetical protein n=1 Tax=Mucilaginibacter sp. TaxID=1882438 RepID=UPI0032677B2C